MPDKGRRRFLGQFAGLAFHLLGVTFNEQSFLQSAILTLMRTIGGIAIPLILMGLVLNLEIASAPDQTPRDGGGGFEI